MVNKALLQQIGLTSGESEVYLALLEIGSTSTGKIIRQSKVHASKVYPILDRLIDKGLVSFIKQGKKKIYASNKKPRRKTHSETAVPRNCRSYPGAGSRLLSTDDPRNTEDVARGG